MVFTTLEVTLWGFFITWPAVREMNLFYRHFTTLNITMYALSFLNKIQTGVVIEQPWNFHFFIFCLWKDRETDASPELLTSSPLANPSWCLTSGLNFITRKSLTAETPSEIVMDSLDPLKVSFWYPQGVFSSPPSPLASSLGIILIMPTYLSDTVIYWSWQRKH